MKGLVWLRNDLRIDDNPALRQACIDANEVHCIYIYSSEQMKLHNQANCKIEFIVSNLIDLNQNLKKYNIPLTIIDSQGFNDNPKKILKSKSFKKLVNETLKKLEKHDGRVNVRASGTESMIRIMVESKNEKETQLASKNLANFAKKLI